MLEVIDRVNRELGTTTAVITHNGLRPDTRVILYPSDRVADGVRVH